MIAERELPLQELIELAKRVQIPGYEAAYEAVHDGVSEGVKAPCVSSGFWLQYEIWGRAEVGEMPNFSEDEAALSTRISASFRTKLLRVLASLIQVLFVNVYCTARGDGNYESNRCPPIWRSGSAEIRRLS
jgi:hypothetical protein